MKDRKMIEMKFEWSDDRDLICDFCGLVDAVGRGVDESGNHITVCERCLQGIDVRLEERAVEMEETAAEKEKQAAEPEKLVAELKEAAALHVRSAAELRNWKGRIKASAWYAAMRAYEAELAAEWAEYAAIERDLARQEEELLPPELRLSLDTEPPEPEAEAA